MKRDKALEAVKELPQEFDLEVLIEKLVFMEQVEAGLKILTRAKLLSTHLLRKLLKNGEGCLDRFSY